MVKLLRVASLYSSRISEEKTRQHGFILPTFATFDKVVTHTQTSLCCVQKFTQIFTDFSDATRTMSFTDSSQKVVKHEDHPPTACLIRWLGWECVTFLYATN